MPRAGSLAPPAPQPPRAAAFAGRCLHQLFEERAREAPGRVAVTAPEGSLSYGELDRRATRLARRLRAAGVGGEARVGLCVGRGADLVVGVLGILKAGGAYLPIDPAYPEARIRLLLDDGGARVAVASPRLEGRLEGFRGRVVTLGGDEDAGAPGDASDPGDSAAGPADGEGAPGVTDESLAYVVYTSGSTGTPKGVMVEHRQVVRLFAETAPWFGFGPDDVWTLFHSVSFDFSVWEMWGALLHGGRLVVVPAETARLAGPFRALLQRERVTVLSQTPSAFRQLVAADACHAAPADLALRLVVLGGERLDVAMLAPWFARYGDQRPAVVNMYGITETTVHVTARRVLRGDLARPEVSPLGVPIPDLRVRLLDPAGNEVPDGTPGEIHVWGPGVARGYLNRPELTARRFLRGPGGVRGYRSGDRAVRLPDGELAYLGRCDAQLKVRGYRVEPGEVEACLAAHPQVGAAVVTLDDHGGGDVRLLATVVPRPGAAAGPAGAEGVAAALHRHAAVHLPPWLRPARYRVVEALPLTPHGKVDRHAVDAAAGQPPAPAGAAGDPIQAAVLEIAREVLELAAPLDPAADLFDLGATSLAFVRLVAEVNQRFGVSLTGAELGDAATLAALAACVRAGLGSPAPA